MLQQGNRTAIFILAALLWGAFGLISPDARAAPDTITLPQSGTLANLKQHARYRPDPDGDLSAEELVGTMEGFQAYDPDWEDSAPPLWLRLETLTPTSTATEYVLRIKRRFFKQLDVYVPNEDGSYELAQSGTEDYKPSTIFGNTFVYPFRSDGTTVNPIFIYIDTYHGNLTPLELSIQDRISFERQRSGTFWAYGLYFGAMLALIFYNFVIYLNLRTAGHLWYVTAMTCVLLFMAMDSGLLPSEAPGWLRDRELMLYVLFASLMPAATTRFFQVFVNSRHHIPGLHKVTQLLIAFCLLISLMALILPLDYVAVTAIGAQIATTLTWVVLIISALMAGLRGSTSSYVFLAAWTTFVASAVARVFISYGFLPRTPETELSIYLGSIMEAMILALGLSYRVGQLRTQRNLAVREQHKAAQLANIDPLTQAYNRRFLENYMDRLLNTDGKRAFQGSLVMIDMDAFKEINDTYGHDAGDSVLQEMAKRCLENLRAEDVLARLGGDEFAIVLPDRSGEDARVVAERIRTALARRPAVRGMQVLPMRVSIGVATNFEPGITSYSAFKRADDALYQAKRAGRNRVVLFTGNNMSRITRNMEADTPRTHIEDES